MHILTLRRFGHTHIIINRFSSFFRLWKLIYILRTQHFRVLRESHPLATYFALPFQSIPLVCIWHLLLLCRLNNTKKEGDWPSCQKRD